MKRNDHYVYPAVFDYSDDGITITFPDLPGCISEADTDFDAMRMARDALGSRLYADLQDGTPIPEPTKLMDVELGSDQRAVLIDVDMELIRRRIKPVYVKKTLTIPEWLNKKASEKGINFSQLLQEALREKLGTP
ncbi:MAG: type II toxin-antitoxin system HicB family antitoxin [Armatimonadota bacterium]